MTRISTLIALGAAGLMAFADPASAQSFNLDLTAPAARAPGASSSSSRC